MNALKGIGAILAGIVFIVVTHTATDFVLQKLGIFTPPDQGFHVTLLHEIPITFKQEIV